MDEQNHRDETKYVGPIKAIIRVAADNASCGEELIFISIDGDIFYPVEPDPEAKLGMEFRTRSKDAKTGTISGPMGYTKRGVMQTTKSYYTGGPYPGYTIETA